MFLKIFSINANMSLMVLSISETLAMEEDECIYLTSTDITDAGIPSFTKCILSASVPHKFSLYKI